MFTFLFSITVTVGFSQWNSNPAINTFICTTSDPEKKIHKAIIILITNKNPSNYDLIYSQ